MLYLFGIGAFNNEEKAVKVGFTDNKEKRIQAYKLHNPLGKFIAWREGDKKLELKLHLRLIDFKETFLDEWFYWEPPVLEIFNDSIENIDKWIWNNKERFFYEQGTYLISPGTLKREIYDELKSKYFKLESDKNSEEKTLSIEQNNNNNNNEE